MTTALPATKRYIRPGIDKVYWMPTVTDYKAVVRADLDAATDLTPEIIGDGVAGFNTTSDLVDTPDWGTRYTSKVSGMVSSDDSSITCYASSDGQDVRTVFTRGQVGFVAFLDGGDTADNPMSVYPVTVSAVSVQRNGSDPAAVQLSFAITAEPSEDQVVPATA